MAGSDHSRFSPTFGLALADWKGRKRFFGAILIRPSPAPPASPNYPSTQAYSFPAFPLPVPAEVVGRGKVERSALCVKREGRLLFFPFTCQARLRIVLQGRRGSSRVEWSPFARLSTLDPGHKLESASFLSCPRSGDGFPLDRSLSGGRRLVGNPDGRAEASSVMLLSSFLTTHRGHTCSRCQRGRIHRQVGAAE